MFAVCHYSDYAVFAVCHYSDYAVFAVCHYSDYAVFAVCHYFRRVRKIAKSDYYVRCVCAVSLSVSPSVHMEHLDFHWSDFHEIF